MWKHLKIVSVRVAVKRLLRAVNCAVFWWRGVVWHKHWFLQSQTMCDVWMAPPLECQPSPDMFLLSATGQKALKKYRTSWLGTSCVCLTSLKVVISHCIYCPPCVVKTCWDWESLLYSDIKILIVWSAWDLCTQTWFCSAGWYPLCTSSVYHIRIQFF